MYRQDLIAVLFIISVSGKRKIDSSEIPLAFSVTKSGSIIYGQQAEHAPVLWLRTHEKRLYIQPESNTYNITHNDILIDGSAWLAPGDQVGIGEALISVGEEQGMLVFEIDIAVRTPLTPPASPPEVTDLDEEMPEPGRQREPEPIATPHLVRASPRNKIRRNSLLAVFALLISGVGFVIAATPVRINIQPGEASISFTGTLPPIPVAGRYLVLPGDYALRADAPGYHKLEELVSVDFGANYDLRFQMKKLPGILDVLVGPAAGTTVAIDGKSVGPAPLRSHSIEPGSHIILVSAERYFPETRTIQIEGKGKIQKLELEMKPAWGTLIVASDPDGATVALNGNTAGQTPAILEPLQGKIQISIQKDGWKTASSTVDIKAGTTIRLPPFRLERVDGQLEVKSAPSGALVTIDDQFRGRTPVSLALLSGKSYRIRLTKPGYGDYTEEIGIDGKKKARINARLKPEYGIVFIRTRPSGATLRVDGKAQASASTRLRLTTAPHRITVSKRGYAPYTASITPRKGISKRLNIQLKRHIEVAREKARHGIPTKGGYIMRLIPIEKPVRFGLGASRREAGRRSNEAQYTVELTRSFMIGETEVTNAEFQRFRAQHSSGSVQGVDLTDPQQPVVSVSWDDAARYANWLSEKENLSPVYREENGKMVAIQPMTTGYRLPTEAEWAFAARYDGGRQSLAAPKKFSWGQSMPPSPNSGNFADVSASVRLSFSIKNYRDGYAVAAPVGKFTPNRLGLYDLAGNVSEWCHDHYDIAVGTTRRLKRDPTGPKIGTFHVIRGSSWRHGRITELRLSYRDYAKTARNDLGFRIARYVNIPK